VDKIAKLDEQMWGVFGRKAVIQIGNEPDARGINPLFDLAHPPLNDGYILWLMDARGAVRKCRTYPPGLGVWKNVQYGKFLLHTQEAWGGYIRMMAQFESEILCAHVYPGHNSWTETDQAVSMRLQVEMAQDAASMLNRSLILTEVGRPGALPVGHLVEGLPFYRWGAGYGDLYDVL